jgi:hypothetical protein
VRCLEVHANDVAEIAADLYPTFVYIEDNIGAKAERLLLCGFAERMEAARQQFQTSWVWKCSPCVRRWRRPAKITPACWDI